MRYRFFHPLKNYYLRLTRGVGCCDISDYDFYLSKRIARDLKVFKQKQSGYRGNLSEGEWDRILGEMICAFEHINTCQDILVCKDLDRVKQGTTYFGEYFQNLWI